MSAWLCEFYVLEDKFNFGRYKGLCLSDVLDINPSYVCWCMKHCSGVIFRLHDDVIEQVKIAYPLFKFKMDNLFEFKRKDNIVDNTCNYHYSDEKCNPDYWEETQTYDRYAGSWAQDVAGYSDDDIDTVFDGDPNAYWNID